MDKIEIVGDAGITAGGNVSIDNTGQFAIGKFINQFKIEKPSGDELFKLIDLLEQKRKEEFNKEILGKYNPSELPAYPPKLREFVTHNRADEITKNMIYLQDHRILLISGIGGVGKTTLACALVETRPASVPLPFWFDFSKKTDATLGDVLEKLASYMKAPGVARFRAERREAGQEDIDILTGELQRREQLWLVFDNLETILKDDTKFHDDDMDLFFTSVRESTHNAKIIITSRTLPLLNNGESLIDALDEKRELKGLKLNFAIDYLIKNGLEGVEREKLEKLATGVDGHPLALRLLIELVKKFGVSDTLKDLSLFQKRKENTIRKARRLFEKLAGDEKELLERISVFRKPETMDAIKEMMTERTCEDAIEKLMDKSLLETDQNGKYWLHPLVREFSYDDLGKKKDIHKLACRYYLSIKLPDICTKKEDVHSLIEAQDHARKAEMYDNAAYIIFDADLYKDLDMWGNYRTLIELYAGVLPKDHFRDKPILSDLRIHIDVLGNLGLAYSHIGQVEKAIRFYEKAHAIALEIRDRRREGGWLGNLGSAYNNLGQIRKAIEYYEEALDISQKIGDREGEQKWVGNLGNAYSFLGQVEKAIQFYEKALAIAQKIGDRRGEEIWLGNLGSAYSSLGWIEKAIQFYEKALAIAKIIGDRRGEEAELGNLGSAHNDLGQVNKAIQFYEKALSIAREIGDRRGEEGWLGNLGNAYSHLGQIETAMEYHEKALAIAQEIGDRKGEETWLGNLGNAYIHLGQIETAIQYREKAVAIAQEIGDRRNEGIWLGNLGLAYYSLGQVEKAIQYYQKGLAIAQEIGDRRGEGNHLNNLGSALQIEKKYREALACYILTREIRLMDSNLKTTESNISKLKDELGENEFEKLLKEVEPEATDIVRKMLG